MVVKNTQRHLGENSAIFIHMETNMGQYIRQLQFVNNKLQEVFFILEFFGDKI